MERTFPETRELQDHLFALGHDSFFGEFDLAGPVSFDWNNEDSELALTPVKSPQSSLAIKSGLTFL
jgi:hypothetical protein